MLLNALLDSLRLSYLNHGPNTPRGERNFLRQNLLHKVGHDLVAVNHCFGQVVVVILHHVFEQAEDSRFRVDRQFLTGIVELRERTVTGFRFRGRSFRVVARRIVAGRPLCRLVAISLVLAGQNHVVRLGVEEDRVVERVVRLVRLSLDLRVDDPHALKFRAKGNAFHQPLELTVGVDNGVVAVVGQALRRRLSTGVRTVLARRFPHREPVVANHVHEWDRVGSLALLSLNEGVVVVADLLVALKTGRKNLVLVRSPAVGLVQNEIWNRPIR